MAVAVEVKHHGVARFHETQRVRPKRRPERLHAGAADGAVYAIDFFRVEIRREIIAPAPLSAVAAAALARPRGGVAGEKQRRPRAVVRHRQAQPDHAATPDLGAFRGEERGEIFNRSPVILNSAMEVGVRCGTEVDSGSGSGCGNEFTREARKGEGPGCGWTTSSAVGRVKAPAKYFGTEAERETIPPRGGAAAAPIATSGKFLAGGRCGDGEGGRLRLTFRFGQIFFDEAGRLEPSSRSGSRARCAGVEEGGRPPAKSFAAWVAVSTAAGLNFSVAA